MTEREPYTHVTKRHHSGGTSVVLYGSKEQCQARADALNEQYQTDEYRVEPYRIDALLAGPWHPHFEDYERKADDRA